MITMLLGGLWHGPSWRFIIWGGLHGGALAFHKLVTEKFDLDSKWWRIAGVVITFHFVCFCWIFFRANDLTIVGQMLSQIFTNFQLQIIPEFIAGYKSVVLLMIIGYILHFIPKSVELKAQEIVVEMSLTTKAACLTAVIVLFLQIKSSGVQPFIYFQF
jgi:D-alanyl-lipoteichoic acid acyltransferase DltB (MBOAT superfamily)